MFNNSSIPSVSDNLQEQQLKDLQRIGNDLNQKAALINGKISNAQETLKKKKEEALALFQTDNLDELRKKRDEIKQKNLEIIAQAERDVARLKNDINEINSKISSIENGN